MSKRATLLKKDDRPNTRKKMTTDKKRLISIEKRWHTKQKYEEIYPKKGIHKRKKTKQNTKE